MMLLALRRSDPAHRLLKDLADGRHPLLVEDPLPLELGVHLHRQEQLRQEEQGQRDQLRQAD